MIPGNGGIWSDNSLQDNLYYITINQIDDTMLLSFDLLPRPTRNESGLILLNGKKQANGEDHGWFLLTMHNFG